MILLSLNDNANVFIEWLYKIMRFIFKYFIKIIEYILDNFIPLCMLLLTRVASGINARTGETKYHPLIFLKFMTEHIDEPSVKVVKKDVDRQFYNEMTKNKAQMKIHNQKILTALEIKNTGNHSMWMAYDATSKHNVCSLYLSSCSLDFRYENDLDGVEMDLSSIVVMKNISTPINSFSINSMVIEYRHKEVVTIENIRKEIRFNKLVYEKEDLFIIINELYKDKKYQLCNPKSSSQEGAPNYEKITMYCTVRSIYDEIYEFKAILKFNGVSVDFEMNRSTKIWERVLRMVLGVRAKGRRKF